jgi:hypothetical protein
VRAGFFDDTTVTVIFLGPHITSGAVQDEHGQVRSAINIMTAISMVPTMVLTPFFILFFNAG